jgi:hypothetical protein
VNDPVRPARKRGAAWTVFGLAALALVLALAMQQTFAAALGGWLGGLWVSVVEAVLRLLGAFLGG